MRRFPATVAGVVACVLAVAPAARADDSSASPTALQLNAAAQADTTQFGVEPGEQNTVAPFGQTCASGHTVGAARTAWYAIQGTGGTITVSTVGSDFDTSLFVYTGSPAGAVTGCSDDDGGGDKSIVTFDSVAGTTYAIQAGRACNEIAPCAPPPSSGMLAIVASGVRATPTAPPYSPPVTGPAALSPNAPGPAATPPGIAAPVAPAAFPALHASSAMSVRYARRYTRVRALRVSGAPTGAAVAVSCLPRQGGCPFTSRTVVVRSSRALTLLAGAKLRRDVVVTVRVTKAGFVGWATRYTIRLHRAPARRVLCLRPGETTERARC